MTNEEHSLDSKLTSYLGQMRALFNQNDNNAIVSVPQIPIEAAGARYGALFLGYEKASVQLKQLIADNSSRVDLVHKVLTAFIIVVMLLISAVVVAPLWLRLISEHKRLESAHRKLSKVAYTDRETGLPNLDGLELQLTDLISFENKETSF